MQFVSSTAVTLTSLVVGIAAAVFSYRNNFGWKPIAFMPR